MQNENLPTEDLKKFGIINEDLSFSKKLNEDDIQKFLKGYTIVADNDKNRATFQLVEIKAFPKSLKTAKRKFSILKLFQYMM